MTLSYEQRSVYTLEPGQSALIFDPQKGFGLVLASPVDSAEKEMAQIILISAFGVTRDSSLCSQMINLGYANGKRAMVGA